MDCPKCPGKLQKTVISVAEVSAIKELRGAALSYELELNRCFVCGGVWFDKGELDKYLTEGLTVVDSASVGADLDVEFDKKAGKCPMCKVPMEKRELFSKPKMIVDICLECDGIWLDSTEIDRLEAANPKAPKRTFAEKMADYVDAIMVRRSR